jgi:tetratricopeptide (TPR) repeat protein
VKFAANFALYRDGHILGLHTVTAEQWQRVKELFDGAVDRDPPGRAAFLAAACGERSAVRAEVERLLKAHDEASSFIDRSPVTGVVASPAEAQGPLSGTVIGRYEIGDLVGSGGMGQVYHAKDVELGRGVAIKFASAGDADAHARLKREAQHASRLTHPNICTIHEVGTYQNQPFIVMELVDGQPLSDLVAGSGLPVEDVVRYGMQIATALAHAHRNGVTHRDLKSANVLVSKDGHAKMLDFGLARALSRDTVRNFSESRESITADGALAGTLSVLAPEILRGEKADTRSDIWALGVLLYEMASGTRPFRGATGFELSGAILHQPPPPLPDSVPASLQAIVQRCLDKDPRNRYQTASDVRAALATVLATRAGPLENGGTLVSKYRLPIVVALVLLAIALYRFLPRRDAESVAVGESGRPAIAVMHFQHAGPQDADSAWLSSGVPSMLMTGLAQTRGLEIVSERRLLEALGPNAATPLASLGKREAADVARRAGASAIVVGTIYRSDAEIRIDAQVEDLSTGRVLAAETVRGTNVFALADQLTSEIRDAVGLADASDVPTVANVSSTSLEAYRLYSEGVQAAANVRMADAEKLLKAAVAIDPSFAEAYMRLAQVSGHLGRKTERQQYFKLARDNVERLSERHRLLLDLEGALDRRDFDTARRTLDEVLTKFPDLEEAYPLALNLYEMGDMPGQNRERLLEITAAGAAALPASSFTRNAYGYALLAAGRYAEAAREFEAYARIAPREPNPHDSLGEAYLKMGDAEKAVAAYSRALAVDPTFPPSHDLRAWSLAVLGRYDEALAEPTEHRHFKAMILSRVGRYREAARVLSDGEADAVARGDKTRAGGLRLIAALLAIERGDNARALRDLPVAAKFLTDQTPDARRTVRVSEYLLSGLAYIQAGRLVDAASAYEAQGRIYKGVNDMERSWRRSLEAEIALARGDLQQAATAFAAIEPPLRRFDASFISPSVLFNDLPSRDGLARVATARGDLDAAVATYRALLAYGPKSKWVSPYEPLYVLQIARLLEKKGDSKAALAEYDRFLTLWKRADAELPELAEARHAVARLR